ncbi:MAG: twin-arginine translocase subunit TatC [Euryarchaeota archaeon]|nr:twin-arginine translocase subunit TatC [Euryarchaeota archaeon]
MADHPESGDSDAPADGSDPTAVDSAGSDSGSADAASDATTTDGGTTQTGLPADESEQSTPSTVDDEFVSDGPESDQEMPLADHIEEMMRRLGIVFLVAGIVTVVVYPFAGETINFLWSSHIPEAASNRPRLYGPLEFILTKLKVAGLAGLLLGLPVFVYQTYRFMRPGLYPTERRYYLASVPTSLVLGIFGVLFSHFLILPFIFAYFTTYTADAAVVAYGLQETFNLILIMMGWMALIFQIPLFIMLAIMMGLVTRRWLEAKRLIFWGSFLGIAFIFSPDPTGMAPIMVTLTMVGLFEGTLALLRWTGN